MGTVVTLTRGRWMSTRRSPAGPAALRRDRMPVCVTVGAARSVTADVCQGPVRADGHRRRVLVAGRCRVVRAGSIAGRRVSPSFDSGTVVTLTATPDVDSTFTGWSGGGCTGTGSCVVTMSAATAVTANFAKVQFALTVTRSGAGGGSVSSTSGRDRLRGDVHGVVRHGHRGDADRDASAPARRSRGGPGGGCAGTGSCVGDDVSGDRGDGQLRQGPVRG